MWGNDRVGYQQSRLKTWTIRAKAILEGRYLTPFSPFRHPFSLRVSPQSLFAISHYNFLKARARSLRRSHPLIVTSGGWSCARFLPLLQEWFTYFCGLVVGLRQWRRYNDGISSSPAPYLYRARFLSSVPFRKVSHTALSGLEDLSPVPASGLGDLTLARFDPPSFVLCISRRGRICQRQNIRHVGWWGMRERRGQTLWSYGNCSRRIRCNDKYIVSWLHTVSQYMYTYDVKL